MMLTEDIFLIIHELHFNLHSTAQGLLEMALCSSKISMWKLQYPSMSLYLETEPLGKY